MNLAQGYDTQCDIGELILNGRPATDHLADRLIANEAERSSVARRGKRADSPGFEVGYYLLPDFTLRYWRRSSTRVIDAPSALRRSSIRS